MKKILYIFLAAVLALTSCNIVEPEEKSALKRDEAAKVTITFPISIPTDGLSTKAMANLPDVKNIYVAVFGSSGYFSEWVPAEPVTELATENEHIYKPQPPEPSHYCQQSALRAPYHGYQQRRYGACRDERGSLSARQRT